MLTGTAAPDSLEPGAPEVAGFDAEAVTLEGAEVLQVLCEIASAPMCEMLPPALHPTLPPLVRWSVHRFPASPWGPFCLAQTRIECRSGVRPRGFLVSGVTDSAGAAEALAAGWGYRLQAGEVSLRRGYDEVRARVEIEGSPVLELGLRGPEPLGLTDIQPVASLHLARTPRGLRLVQVDPGHVMSRAERGEPLVESFDAAAWGEPRIVPVYPVSASVCTADVTLPKLRFVCRPDVTAFEGTEPV